MKPAALGFRVHSGWTSLIALAVEKKQPVILARQRPHLVATFSYTFRQPYHTAEKMDLVEASAFLQQQCSEARALALTALRAAQTEAAHHDCGAVGYIADSFVGAADHLVHKREILNEIDDL